MHLLDVLISSMMTDSSGCRCWASSTESIQRKQSGGSGSTWLGSAPSTTVNLLVYITEASTKDKVLFQCILPCNDRVIWFLTPMWASPRGHPESMIGQADS